MVCTEVVQQTSLISIYARVGKTLQWWIWLLHVNELPLRHVFTALDRKQARTSGVDQLEKCTLKYTQSCFPRIWQVMRRKQLDPLLSQIVSLMDLEVIQRVKNSEEYFFLISSYTCLVSSGSGLKYAAVRLNITLCIDIFKLSVLRRVAVACV